MHGIIWPFNIYDATTRARDRNQEGSGRAGDRILLLLTKDFSKLLLISAFIAIPFGWFAMQQWLAAFAYHTAIGWWTFGLAVLIPVAIALLTVSIRSVRAAMVNPAKTLRTE